MKNLYFVPVFLLLTSSAFAQFPGYNYRDDYGGSSSSTPIVNYKSDYQFERERVLAMMQARRDERHAAHLKTWASSPRKLYTSEDRAKSRFDLAHQLYLIGKPDAARRWLEQLLVEFPTTATSDRARLVLTRL